MKQVTAGHATVTSDTVQTFTQVPASCVCFFNKLTEFLAKGSRENVLFECLWVIMIKEQ